MKSCETEDVDNDYDIEALEDVDADDDVENLNEVEIDYDVETLDDVDSTTMLKCLMMLLPKKKRTHYIYTSRTLKKFTVYKLFYSHRWNCLLLNA